MAFLLKGKDDILVEREGWSSSWAPYPAPRRARGSWRWIGRESSGEWVKDERA
jgi:hypothetical protein